MAPPTTRPPTDDLSWSLIKPIKQSAPIDLSKTYDRSTLLGKTIIITGGSSGFGSAFAREWASHGAQIIIGDLNDSAGEALVSELNNSFPLLSSSGTTSSDGGAADKGKHHFQHCDVTSWSDQVSLFQLARRVSLSGLGQIHGVVAGAGIVETGNLVAGPTFEIPCPSSSSSSSSSENDSPPEPPLKVMAVNMTGVMYTVHLALYHLDLQRSTGEGDGGNQDRHILLVSSLAGICPLPGQVEYTVSKHGVMGLFRSLRATSMLRQGIRVNVINPYFVETPLINDRGVGLLAGGGMAKVEDVVDAATRLMSDEGIVGRGLAIGPKVRVVDDYDDSETGGIRLVGDKNGGGGGREQAVWEIYGHDYEMVEVFIYRFVKLVNLVTKIRGWVGFFKDLWRLRSRRSSRGSATTGTASGVRSGRVEKKKTS